MFRGYEIQPQDILSFRTALGVSSHYHFSLEAPHYYLCICWVILMFCGFLFPEMPLTKPILIRILSMVIGVAIILTIQNNPLLKADHWQKNGSMENGTYLNLLLEFNEGHVKKPLGYSALAVEELENQYSDSDDINGNDFPNILVIMSESFSDLSVLGEEIRTNIPVTPYYDSLKENTVRGHVFSSVYGGNTPNSEFEFLTGHSMSFFPKGSVPYQQYIHTDIHSIVRELKKEGYTTVGTHPYYSTGWARNKVYSYLGFDKVLFLDDYPQQKMVRGLVSDEEMYDQLIRLYEDKNTNEKLFIFSISMQNHGAYDYSGDDFQTDVKLIDYNREYEDVNQYLSLLHLSDLALEKLITYFQHVDDKVVIVFFGDHQPRLNSDFSIEVHGGEFKSLSERELFYRVPFFIWTNYEIDEISDLNTSINYLSTHMLKTAGIPLPPYNRFLSDLEERIPIINALGYYSTEEKSFLPFDLSEPSINSYSILEYNSIFEKKNRSDVFFPLR